MLFKDNFLSILAKNELTESHKLQIDALAELQVFLSCDEKFYELSRERLLDTLDWVILSGCALVEHAALAYDGRLHAKRWLRHGQRFHLSLGRRCLISATATAIPVLCDEGRGSDYAVPLHAIRITENVSSLVRAGRVLTCLGGSLSAFGRLKGSQSQISLHKAFLLYHLRLLDRQLTSQGGRRSLTG